MRCRFTTWDVFTDRPFAGNPLAVLPDARGLDEPRMLAVAREFGFSETTFVLPPSRPEAARRVRIFTPGGEIPFAGHPTIGTACALVAGGFVPLAADRTKLTLDLAAGPTVVAVTVDETGHAATLTAPQAPVLGPRTSPALVAAALGVGEEAVDTTVHLPVDVGTGLAFVAARLRDLQALGACRPDLPAWAALPTAAAGHGIVVYVPIDDHELRVRMFAPGVGVVEDPATGSAAAALGGLLAGLAPGTDGTLAWVLHQGIEMGRPSRLDVAVDKRAGEVVAVRVGGRAVPVTEGWIDLPD